MAGLLVTGEELILPLSDRGQKVNGGFYSPAARTTIMTKSDPTAPEKLKSKTKKQSARELITKILFFSLVSKPSKRGII